MGRLFDSLRRIAWLEVEVIFVNNNSDADTVEYVKAFAEELRQSKGIVAKVIDEPRPGACAARNKGLDAATGHYVYFFDSDDELSPDFFEQAYSLAQSTNADAVGLRINIVKSDGTAIVKNQIPSNNPKFQIVCNNFSTPSLFLKREFALLHGRWNNDVPYWNDLEWAFRIMLAKPVISWLPGAWHKTYIHNESITGNFYAQRIDKIILAHAALTNDIDNCQWPEDSKQHFAHYLNCRKALYAGRIRKEGAADAAKTLYDTIDFASASFLQRFRYRFLYFLSAIGVPGVWRLGV